jgi:copper chaperone
VQEKLTLSIEGMHCEACVRRVSAALRAIAGVELNIVEIGSARMGFDAGFTNPKEIAAAVSAIGFSARI